MFKYFLALVFILLHRHAIAQTEIVPSPAKATFGRYGPSCSSGRGLCSFKVLGEESRLVTHIRSWKIATNSIIVEFRKDLLSIDDQISIAGQAFDDFKDTENAFFIQQTQLVIDKESLANLGLDLEYDTLEAGNYRLRIDKDRAIVIIQLKSSE